jgi:hypothetical protein
MLGDIQDLVPYLGMDRRTGMYGNLVFNVGLLYAAKGQSAYPAFKF